MTVKRILLAAVGVGMILETGAALGQTEEIIVTARKREESILRVPVVATAITQEALEKYQTNDLYAVANKVPGFVMGESVGTVGIQTSLRGIGPTSQTATVDQSVSLNIDGLSLTQGYAFAAGMFDLAQIEVLKGPQALFYGKNSTAGVISLRSADPKGEFELTGRTGYEVEANEVIGEAIVSGPVADSLKLRLAARYSEMDGFFKNDGEPVPGYGNRAPKYRDFAPKRSWILRGTALIDPIEAYQARLKFSYVEDRMDGSGGDGQIVYCPDGTGGVPPLNFAFIGDSDCKLDRHTQLGDFDPAYWPGIRNGGVPFADSKQTFGTLEQTFDVSKSLSIASVTGLYKINQDNLIRGSGSSNPTLAADFTFETRQFTQELRLTSDFEDSPVNFMIGAFYQDAEIEVQNRLRGNTAFGLAALVQSGLHEVDVKSISAFGQVLWKVTPQVEVAAGARYTDEERDHALFNDLTNSEVDLLEPELRAKNTSPELSVTYTPTDDLTLFGAYRQGFKSGSFNTVVVASSTQSAAFGDEKAKGGEVGLKARLLDRSLAVNVAAYRYKYSDLQVGANDISETGVIQLRTINAASAKVQGIEADASYSPPAARSLTLFGDVNYNRARFTSFPNAPCSNGQTIGEGCDQVLNTSTGRYTSQDLSHRPLVRAPEWTASLGFDYDLSIGTGKTLSFGATARYTDNFYTNLVELPEYLQDSYIKTNANLALKADDGAWEVALIGNNLANKITTGHCSNSNSQNGTVLGGQLQGGLVKGAAGSDEVYCVAERGREVWVRFTVRPLAWTRSG